MRVAIVVPTPDANRELTQRCLAHARATTKHLNVVIEVVESSGPNFRFSRSINRGIQAHPDADAWVLLNDDCFMDYGWLDAMLATIDKHPHVGVVGAVLRYPSGRLQHAGGRLMPALTYFWYCLQKMAPFWGLKSTWAMMTKGLPYFGHYEALNIGHRLDFVTGACQLITRRCYEAIGGYDEGFEFTFEDVDYCLRARAAGFEVAMATAARGVHLERATGRKKSEAITRSTAYFHQRWKRSLVKALRHDRPGVYHGSP